MKHKEIKRLVFAALCLALCWVLPFFTGNNRALSSMLSLMHIPALLCGFVCGWPYGLAVGLLGPLTRHLMFQMPPLTTAISMAAELGIYGLCTGLFYRLLPKKIPFLYVNLVISILAGRIAGGLAKFAIAGVQHTSLTFGEVFTAMMVTTLPGTAIQLVLIPLIVIALKKANLFCND